MTHHRKHEAIDRQDVVRVTVPADIAFDLDRFQKVTEDLAERLGCRACLSGAACVFELERNFRVNEQGKFFDDPSPQPN